MRYAHAAVPACAYPCDGRNVLSCPVSCPVSSVQQLRMQALKFGEDLRYVGGCAADHRHAVTPSHAEPCLAHVCCELVVQSSRIPSLPYEHMCAMQMKLRTRTHKSSMESSMEGRRGAAHVESYSCYQKLWA